VDVEGAVMEPAKGQAVRRDGLASRMAVGKDVRGVEELSEQVPLLPRHDLKIPYGVPT
jgi:hypothetical protein